MNHAGNLASVFSLYRKTVSSVTHGDHRILQIRPGRTIYHGVQGVMHLVIHLTHGTADLQKRCAGVICHLIIGKNTAADLRSQCRNRIQKLKGFIQRIPTGVVGFPLSILADLTGSLQKGHDLQELSHSQNTADLQTLQRTADIADTTK